MNEITENKLFCLERDRNSGKHGARCPLFFEFVVGNMTPVPEGHSTQWRKMPFHLCCFTPEMPEGAAGAILFEDGENITFTEPSVVFIPAGTTHRIDDHGPARNSIWIHFRLLALPDLDLFTHCKTKAFVTRKDRVAIAELLHRIVAAPSKLDTVHGAWFQLYGLTLCYKLMNLAGIDPDKISTNLTPDHKRLLPALELLHNSTKKPSLSELADAVHLSPSRFQTLFRQEMKTSPGKMYRKIQFAHACRLLADPERSIGECAEQLGFSDAFHFSREFRKLSGLPPSEYRKQFCPADKATE